MYIAYLDVSFLWKRTTSKNILPNKITGFLVVAMYVYYGLSLLMTKIVAALKQSWIFKKQASMCLW